VVAFATSSVALACPLVLAKFLRSPNRIYRPTRCLREAIVRVSVCGASGQGDRLAKVDSVVKACRPGCERHNRARFRPISRAPVLLV
jgi:hypothetical protein